jgi:DNA-binding FadR family transcriptional regulator
MPTERRSRSEATKLRAIYLPDTSSASYNGLNLVPSGMTAFDHIAHDLRKRISQGEWPAGVRLPTERSLAQSYDVSRNTIRRALGELEGHGLLSRHVGRGTYVISSGAPPRDNEDTFMQRMASASPVAMLEVRLIIEPQVTALAAARASKRDLETIKAVLAGSLSAENATMFEGWDVRLHQAICDAAHNDLLSDYLRALSKVRSQPQWVQLNAKCMTAERRAVFNMHHREVVAALLVRDATGAAQKMREHLRAVRDATLPFL